MDQNLRCQSCGMPLGDEFFGSNRDGSDSHEYCRFCWQQGDFTNPKLTLQSMIDRSIAHMTSELKMPPDTAAELANRVIPTLRRWRQ